MTPVSQPSGLGELSASMLTEPDMKKEVIQRAQVGSLMGANGNKEPQDKTPKKQSPASATRPKKYALIFGLCSTSNDWPGWSMDLNSIWHPSPAKKMKCSFLD